ncbi:hypothetical protein HMPREF1317_0684 [Schaalia georgiae F0490]|uniref:Uncharacterized protein n=1 Tax=Schaalia georgiae F0490 TaxID=1125717 RepID=J0P2W1_9ACTO|nr:hypothetical protein HMPREF1317_0684 [Schaalia georgiae F0490]
MPWAANTVILALAEREDIMVAWGNHVGVSEIARPCRAGRVRGVARDPQGTAGQPGPVGCLVRRIWQDRPASSSALVPCGRSEARKSQTSAPG